MLAQNLHQLFVNNLDHLLPRGQRLHHFLAHRLHLDGFDELLHYAEVDIGFQQRDADLFERHLHVLGR